MTLKERILRLTCGQLLLMSLFLNFSLISVLVILHVPPPPQVPQDVEAARAAEARFERFIEMRRQFYEAHPQYAPPPAPL